MTYTIHKLISLANAGKRTLRFGDTVKIGERFYKVRSIKTHNCACSHCVFAYTHHLDSPCKWCISCDLMPTAGYFDRLNEND